MGTETAGERTELWGRRALDDAHWRLLMLLGAATFFEGYDFNVITVALKPIRESFGASQASAAAWIAVVYLGAVPAVAAARVADRYGRRPVLLGAMLSYTVATGVTALAPNMVTFVGVQFAARFFLVLQSSLVWTIVAEEMPASARGFGFGWMAMLSALGTGWCAILNGSVIAPLHLSWRWLYPAALPVLFVLARLRGSLTETDRYQDAVRRGATSGEWLAITRRPYGRRLAVLGLAALLGNLTAQATAYVVDFMESQRHLSASAASFTLVLSGALAIPVLLISGSVSDRIGRKPVVCGFIAVSVVGFYCFFELARGVPALFGSLALVYVGVFGSWPTGSGFGTELFPTDLRAFGNAFGNGARYIGQSLSFLIAGALIGGTRNLAHTVLLLSIGPVLAGVLIAVGVPETGGRQLEDLVLREP